MRAGTATWSLTFATLSLACAVMELLAEPRRAIFVLSYLPAFALAGAVYTFDGPASGVAAFAAAVAGLQGRLFLFGLARDVRDQARRFAADLKASLPAKVFVFIDVDIESEVERSAVHEGHLIRVRPGDVLPCDGQVTYGSSFVDESSLNGEKEPRTKGMGSFVYAGTVNKNGSFLYRALAAPENSHLMRVARSLEKGFSFESIFSPALFLSEATVGAFAIAFFLYEGDALGHLLNVFLASGGAGLAAAIAARDWAVIVRGAAEGAAWRDKEAVGRVAATEAVVSPAPGVITEGRFRLTAVEGTEHTGEDGALRLLGPLARRLENEVAFSILRELQTRNIPLESVEAFSLTPGGATGLVTGEEVRWVDLETARVENVPMAKLEAFAREHTNAGESVILLLREDRAAAALAFLDRPQDSAAAGLGLLRRLDISYLLVTPERESTTRRLKEELALLHVHNEAGARETEALLGRLEQEGLAPLWISAPGAAPVTRRAATLAAVGANAEGAELVGIRSELYGVARLLKLARLYGGLARGAFRVTVVSQVGLILLGLLMDPRLAALAGILPGLFLVSRARALLQERL